MLVQIKQLGRRFLLMLSGEILQSAFHFAFNVALVRMLPAWDYGFFAIVMLVGALSLTYVRSFAGMPAGLFIPAQRSPRRAAAFEVTFGSWALAISGLIGAGVGVSLSPWLGAGALPAGAFIGLWSLRSFLRTALFASRRQVQSTISDTVFSGSGVILALCLIRGHDHASLDRVFLTLALANALAIGVALGLPRRRIRVSFRYATRRRFMSMAPQLAWSCAGVTTANVQAQGQVLLIAAIVGPAAYAPIAAALVFYAPLRLVASALANMMQPELAQCTARGDEGRIRQLLVTWTAAMLAVGLGCGAATVLAFPLIKAPVFVGQPKMLIAVLACALSIAPLFYVMPKVLLEVRRAFRTIAVMTSVSAVLGMSLVAILLGLAGPVWSLLGSLASEALVMAWCWLAVGTAPPSSVAASPSLASSTRQPRHSPLSRLSA